VHIINIKYPYAYETHCYVTGDQRLNYDINITMELHKRWFSFYTAGVTTAII